MRANGELKIAGSNRVPQVPHHLAERANLSKTPTNSRNWPPLRLEVSEWRFRDRLHIALLREHQQAKHGVHESSDFVDLLTLVLQCSDHGEVFARSCGEV